MENGTQSFPIISSNRFIGFADGNIVSWCPTMDLLAISMNKMSIWVFRINGERIYSINNKSVIIDISWNPNGKFFCVSGIDGYCKIYDSNSGKLVNSVGNREESVGLINWCYHEDLQDDGKIDSLFKVDVLGHLPKLSLNNELSGNSPVGTTSNNSNGNFQLDEINDTERNSLNFLLAVKSNSRLSFTFKNRFTIEGIPIPDNLKFLCHANNMYLMEQFFLVKNELNNSLELLQLSLDVPNANNLRNYLMEILQQSCKVISIMSYVKEQLIFLNDEIKPFIQFFDRHLSNFKDSLYANVDLTVNFPTDEELKCKITNSLFDLLLTSVIPNDLKDFWLNQFGERGLKKLHKMGNVIYDSIRKTCFSQLIASLERLLIILNEIQGLVKWLESIGPVNNGHDIKFGLSLASLEEIVGLSKNLLQYFYKLIWDINEEQKLFNDFINWVKLCVIDKLSKEDDIDSYYNSLHINYKNSDLIKYFNEYLFNSRLFKYFEVKLPMNEVLSQSNVDVDLIEKFNELNHEVENNLLNNIREYVKSTIRFGDSISLNIPFNQEHEKMKIFNNPSFGIICSINTEESSLTITKFSLTHPNELQTKVIIFKSSIINYEITNGKQLVLLVENSPRYVLESINFDKVFDQENHIIPYDTIVPINQRIFGADVNDSIKAPKFLAINDARSKLIGCLLDANKRNYIIFDLNHSLG